MIKKIFGPPGSGKTTFLLNTVEKELERDISSTAIGYFAFTRRAALEAKERAAKKFPNLDIEKDLPWFRTLHSLAYACLGVKNADIMSSQHFKEFSSLAKLELTVEKGDEDFIVKTDNPILNQINLARITGMDLKEHYNRSDIPIEWWHFEYVERFYRKYKENNNLHDFTDLLERLVDSPERVPELDTVIIDEAQDLSRLQWDVVKILADKAKTTYIAGDDDQAIYVWAGADVDQFLDLSGEIKVLDKSYRIPEKVYKLAINVVNRIGKRQDKEWEPKQESGQVNLIDDCFQINFEKGEWLILAPTNYLLNPLHDYLLSQGVLFERNGQKSISEKILSAVLGWEALRKGKEIPLEVVSNIYKYLNAQYIKRGHKNLKTATKDRLYSLDLLTKEHGLLTDNIWHEALTKIAQEKRSYIVALLRRGIKLRAKAPVRLSTIHGAKGSESDNVVLLTDLSTKFAKQISTNPDDMRRLFYVGITRTKESLYLVRPTDQQKSLMF